ncbi:uncharacterized protein LOC131937410 [Physella acuta]|uniref:uncharacterized protein LOC131937410 n=1 Tax=Physella acuta TaxID=109671 RepID=UPI0027DE46C5|nr:uncharacterized protein LOC131937410 [Physella acuta]
MSIYSLFMFTLVVVVNVVVAAPFDACSLGTQLCKENFMKKLTGHLPTDFCLELQSLLGCVDRACDLSGAELFYIRSTLDRQLASRGLTCDLNFSDYSGDEGYDDWGNDDYDEGSTSADDLSTYLPPLPTEAGSSLTVKEKSEADAGTLSPPNPEGSVGPKETPVSTNDEMILTEIPKLNEDIGRQATEDNLSLDCLKALGACQDLTPGSARPVSDTPTVCSKINELKSCMESKGCHSQALKYYYDSRMANIASIYGINCEEYIAPPRKPTSLDNTVNRPLLFLAEGERSEIERTS